MNLTSVSTTTSSPTMNTATELCPSSSIHMVKDSRVPEGGGTETAQSKQNLCFCCCFPDNGYHFPYSNFYREKRDTSVSLIKRNEAAGTSRRRKDPVLLLPWWKEIIGTIFFCIAATTYIVRKFFHPPAPVTHVRVRSQTPCVFWLLFSSVCGGILPFSPL